MPVPAPPIPDRRLASLARRLLRARRLVRAPIWLYRVRLGFIFGPRLLMLEHTGRKSGARRYVILEVVDRPRPGCYLVASGFGTRSQWFRNVRANPYVRVWHTGHRPARATARLLSSEETAIALSAYAARHPRAWATLKPVFEATLGARIDSSGATLPMIALETARRDQVLPGPRH
jgi:deazaflavin-dependent oxidoreductase (nitroreductase family)